LRFVRNDVESSGEHGPLGERTPMRRLNKQTWGELRRLFVAGWSLGQLAKRFGVPKGTLCAKAAKERWSAERIEGQTLHNNQVALSDDHRGVDLIGATLHALRRAVQCD